MPAISKDRLDSAMYRLSCRKLCSYARRHGPLTEVERQTLIGRVCVPWAYAKMLGRLLYRGYNSSDIKTRALIRHHG